MLVIVGEPKKSCTCSKVSPILLDRVRLVLIVVLVGLDYPFVVPFHISHVRLAADCWGGFMEAVVDVEAW